MATRTITLVASTDTNGVPISFVFSETGTGVTATATSETNAVNVLRDILERKRLDLP
jgi:hypothetical protein